MSKKQNDIEVNFQCQRCGECCSLFCIPCTDQDIKRILNHLKLPLEVACDYVELVEPEDDILESYEDVPKVITEEYDSQNIVLVLKSGDDEKYCCFYKKNECTIYPVRPLVCRFFPIVYEYEENNELKLIKDPKKITFSLYEEGDYCKGIGRGNKVNFDNFRELTVQTIKEDKEYLDLVNIWNLKVIFERIENWSEKDFIEFILHFEA